MKVFVALVLILVGLSASADCQNRVDLQAEKAELLRLHRADREAHFKTNVETLLADSSEEMIAVSAGKIHRDGKTEARKRFTEYFRGVKYHEWNDLEEPIIRVSKDGSMAWMITRLRSRRTQRDGAGKEAEQQFIYAGIMTYEKLGAKWVRVANVSTFEPAP